MRSLFQPGDRKSFRTEVTADQVARFPTGVVHPIYSTFALGQDAEWACRLFVLDLLEPGEEGLGTFLSIRHLAPAPVGAEVELTAELIYIREREVHCRWWAEWQGTRLAEGEQTQVVVDQARWQARLERLSPNPTP